MENQEKYDVHNVHTVEELIRVFPEGRETILDLLDEGGESVKTIEVRRRALQPERPEPPEEMPLARALARNHVFNDIEAFAAYLNREAHKDASLVLADVSNRVITAVLNEGSETDRETVTLQAIEHPLFSPWGSILDRAIDVVDFALFAMKHRRAVVTPDGRELAMLFSQVKMARNVTMYRGTGKHSLNGVMIEVEIAGEKKGFPEELPEMIAIEVPLFVGSSAQRIELDLLVTNRGEAVVVYATAATVAEQRIVAFEEMVDKLSALTGQLVGLGTIQQRSWKTLQR